MRSRIRSSVAGLLVALGLALWSAPQLPTAVAAEAVAKPTFRTKNLDYFDADTLQYYLQEPAPAHEFDVAVLFYASWDSNSRSLAPMWGQVAHLLQAGTVNSRLLVGLFDCELNQRHMQLCTRAGVTHYPTMTFLSLSGHSFGGKAPRHATTFRGNWMYGDAILDWLKALGGLSQWHRAGWGKRLRAWLFRNPRQVPPQLPVGIPGAGGAATAAATASTTTRGGGAAGAGAAAQGSGSPSSSSSAATTAALARAESELQEYKELLVRGNDMLEAMLFPLTSNASRADPSLLMQHDGRNFTDLFAELHKSKAWDSKAPRDFVLSNCLLEMSLDYCQRVLNDATSRFLTYYESLSTEEQAATNMTQLQRQLDDMVNETEPYCAVLEDCIRTSSTAETCRPAHCPFQDQTVCRYVTSCLSGTMMDDYAVALGLDLSGSSGAGATTPQKQEERQTKDQGSSEKKKKNIWGI